MINLSIKSQRNNNIDITCWKSLGRNPYVFIAFDDHYIVIVFKRRVNINRKFMMNCTDVLSFEYIWYFSPIVFSIYRQYFPKIFA